MVPGYSLGERKLSGADLGCQRAFRGRLRAMIPILGVIAGGEARLGFTFADRVGQQVVRLDREPAEGPNPHLRRELVLAAREYGRASDAFLVSDYGYGAATPALLSAVREKRGLNKVPVTLDSRHRMMQFSGITAATPNEAEVEEMLELGQLAPDCIHTPGVFVDAIFQGAHYEKRIERRTVRKR
jgi:hypothetical protein